MNSRRVLKAANAIRQVVSMAILTEIKDPRVTNVTVTSVEVTPDLRQARVNVSILGDEKAQNLTLKGLRNAAGFLQSRVAERIETRYTPRLEFRIDQGVKNSLEVARILDEVLPAERGGQSGGGTPSAESPPRDPPHSMDAEADHDETTSDLIDGDVNRDVDAP